MKYLGLLTVLFLAGCQSTPSFCEREPDSDLCNQKTYHYQTVQALENFKSQKNQKAFALGQAADGWQSFGYGAGYSSSKKAQERALKECQTRLDKHGAGGQCELIR